MSSGNIMEVQTMIWNLQKSKIWFRRSLYFNKDIEKGSVIKESDISRIRPGFGLEIKYLNDVIGKELKVSIKYGDRVSFDVFE